MDLALACTHGRWIGEAQFAACVPCIAIALTRAEALAGALDELLAYLEHKSPGEMLCGQFELNAINALAAWRARDEAGKE